MSLLLAEEPHSWNSSWLAAPPCTDRVSGSPARPCSRAAAAAAGLPSGECYSCTHSRPWADAAASGAPPARPGGFLCPARTLPAPHQSPGRQGWGIGTLSNTTVVRRLPNGRLGQDGGENTLQRLAHTLACAYG